MIATNIRPKNIVLEKQQKPLHIHVIHFYASKLQDYVEAGLLFQKYTKTYNLPMPTQITYFQP